MTTWKPVPGWEQFYEVSDDGQVRRFDYWQPGGNGAKRLIPAGPVAIGINPDGYARVELKRQKRRVLTHVHVLVAEAFLPPRPVGATLVRHLDGNPGNNAASNLAWGAPADNTQDMIRHGRHVNGRKTECKHGHALTADNVYVRRNGRRMCRECKRDRDRRYYRAQDRSAA